MRFIYVFAFSVLTTVGIGTIVKSVGNQNHVTLVSPLVAGINTEQAISSSSGQDSYQGWQIFVNNYNHYKIRHPSDVIVKNNRNGDIGLIKNKAININITQKQLGEHSTLNTVIETDIDSQKNILKNNFYLLSNISPIALGSTTSYTYSSEENSQKYIYFYVPQDESNFLLIKNKVADFSGTDYLVSEKIIFSLENQP